MPNYYQHNGANYVHVSDYAALEARLAEAEEKRTKQLRQQGDAWAADAARYKARLAEAEDAIERAGRCLAMSNKGAAEALAILMVYKQADSASVEGEKC